MPKHIVTTATTDYTYFLYPFIQSCRASLLGTYDLTIIHDGFSGDVQDFIHSLSGNNVHVKFVDIGEFSDYPVYALFDRPVYWRLIAPYVVSTSQVLFLDADTLVRDDLSDLFDMDLTGRTLGACQDYLASLADGVNNYAALGLDPDAPYFNAGVLLIDTDKYIRNNIAERVHETVFRNARHLIAYDTWPQHDQYGLNVALYGDWYMMPRVYNYGSELPYLSTAKIVHFIGNGKPGVPTCCPQYTREFRHFSNRYV